MLLPQTGPVTPEPRRLQERKHIWFLRGQPASFSKTDKQPLWERNLSPGIVWEVGWRTGVISSDSVQWTRLLTVVNSMVMEKGKQTQRLSEDPHETIKSHDFTCLSALQSPFGCFALFEAGSHYVSIAFPKDPSNSKYSHQAAPSNL
jgi:hypothetical protein